MFGFGFGGKSKFHAACSGCANFESSKPDFLGLLGRSPEGRGPLEMGGTLGLFVCCCL